MISKFALWVLAAAVCLAASNPVAVRLAEEAQKSAAQGQFVRAYLLYAEAAQRDPDTARYAVERERLKPLADLLKSAGVEDADIAKDVQAAEANPGGPNEPLPLVSIEDLNAADNLQPPPHLEPQSGLHDFDLRLDERTAITQVAQAYGIQVVFDPDFDSKPLRHFQISHADFRTVMEGLASATQTFVFPISSKAIFVARDLEAKRNEFEPDIVVTVPVPNALKQQDVVEAANAVRGVLSLRAIMWDSAGMRVVIRDRIRRANIARSLLEALLLPRAEVSIEVQLLEVDRDVNYHYGLGLPTSFPIYSFVRLGGFQNILPDLSSITSPLLAFGGGSSFFGLALSSAKLFGAYTKSTSKVKFDATLLVADGQSASIHVGEKYPIQTTTYSGFSQNANNAIYNPIGQITQEDLGLVLKIGARVNGDGDISLDTDAQYESLGAQSFNTIPAINQRQFKGSVRLREGEYAVIGGIEDDEHTFTRSGFAGVSRIPGLSEVLSETTRDHSSTSVLVVIKPTIKILPMSSVVSPQFLLGSMRGTRVVM